ncbi:hypothetical protein Hamer_G001014 [Homarus americanus]|uniref:Uncharacterized protein n=1 Tax=Homarus americanus TaxID=6706 RepID=A0A8J5TGJ1_HOMAM|nr:hypothetical protein Hamer_G001014 [Homarus americanus]
MKATVGCAWSALLPQLKSAKTKRQQPTELMNPGFQEVTREDLDELMQEGNTNDVEDFLEDEEGGESGDAASDAGETEQRKVTTQKLSLLLGVFTSLLEMIQDIESESGEREQVIGVLEFISRKYQTQYNERVNARQQSLITRFLSQCRPAEEDQQREVEVDEDIDDSGQMPEDFDFAGFDEVLAEVGEPGARGQHCENVPCVIENLLLSDEAHFQLSSYVNKQNNWFWADVNPQELHEKPLHSKKVTVWCAISLECVIDPYFFEEQDALCNSDIKLLFQYVTNFLHPRNAASGCGFIQCMVPTRWYHKPNVPQPIYMNFLRHLFPHIHTQKKEKNLVLEISLGQHSPLI